MRSRDEHERLSPVRMTLEEWADLDDDDDEGELVDGWLVEDEAWTIRHDLVTSWFMMKLGDWAEKHRGVVLASRHKLAVGDTTGRKPDVSFYRSTKGLRWRDTISRVPPTVVVEVLSGRPQDVRRDRIDKVRDYARFGVRFYWLVDPRAQLVEFRELDRDGRYVMALVACEGKAHVPGFEDFVLDLDDLWAHVAEVEADEADESDRSAEGAEG